MKVSWTTNLVTLITLIAGTLHSVDAAHLRCYKGSLASYTVIELKNNADPNTLLKSSCYSSDKDIIFYTHGFLQTITDNSGLLVLQAYLDDGTKNVIGLDWSDENSIPVAGAGAFVKAALNAIEVGKKLGKFVTKLINAGLPITSIHLIGFSLGADLMGATGRQIQDDLSQSVPRITGLEPAGPLYSSPVSLPKLTKNDGIFVEAYHTNPGKIGTNEALTTVDIWVNCVSSVQPGCEDAATTNIGLFAPKDICSHLLGPAVFATALRNSTEYVATSAADCEAWANEDETTGATIYLGDGIDTTATGNYYIAINTDSDEYQTSAAEKENNDLQQRQLNIGGILG